MVTEKLQKKIDSSIRLLQSVQKRYDGEIEIAYSGGKDSDVILQLAKEAGIKYRAIYKNTTIDPPGTLKHVREMEVEILRPKDSFFHLIAQKGFPNRFSRFCCKILKEYKVLDKSVIGVRKAESRKRNERYNEPTQCRYYGSKKEENHVEQIFPILNWTNEDVRDFIIDRKLKLAPNYYNHEDGGKIDISKRLGCMCCPLKSSKKRIIEFQKYPKLAKAYIRAGQRFMDTHPDSITCKRYDNIYEWFTRDIFYSSDEDWNKVSAGLFGKPDFKKFLEGKFGIDLTL